MVGGSGLVMGAMTTLDLMGTPAGPRPALSGKSDARVLVLGAGISGLTVGYELGKLGYDYQILEARDRVGGVNHTIRQGTRETDLDGVSQTCEFDEGQYLNGGTWRIPHVHTAVLAYCKELGVPLEIFINDTDASYLYFEGEGAGQLAGQRTRLRDVKMDVWGQVAELLAKALDQGQLDAPLSAEDKERLLAYLVREGYLSTPDLVYRGGEPRGSGDPYDLSVLFESGLASRVQWVEGGRNRAPMFQPVGGMDQLPKAFARAIPDRITLGAEVQQIQQTEDQVRVVYEETANGTKHELTADYVVCCMPLSVLSGIDVNLSPDMMDTVRNTRYSSSAKIGVQMRRRFWEEDDGIFGGRAYTNLPLGQFSFPSTGYCSQKGVILGFYGNGGIGGLSDMSNPDRIEHVISNASKVHPQMREEFEAGYAVFWEKIRYSQGAYVSGGGFGGGGSDANPRVEQLSKPDNRIYIGCAAASSSPAWMEGAISAGWQTVESLHERVGQT